MTTDLSLSYPSQTKTVTGKEWRDHCTRHETKIFINGELYQMRIRSLGAGVYELYCIPAKVVK